MELVKTDLSDTGPYATTEDAETARKLGITVTQLRKDRAAEDKPETKSN